MTTSSRHVASKIHSGSLSYQDFYGLTKSRRPYKGSNEHFAPRSYKDQRKSYQDFGRTRTTDLTKVSRMTHPVKILPGSFQSYQDEQNPKKPRRVFQRAFFQSRTTAKIHWIKLSYQDKVHRDKGLTKAHVAVAQQRILPASKKSY